MTNLKIYGRVFYGLGIAGIGIMHFFYEGFRPIIMPVPPEATANIQAIIYLIAIGILVSGVMICTGKNVRNIALLLGFSFFLFLVFGHLPNRLKNHPEIMGYWIDAIKLFALSGGALVAAQAYPIATPNRFFNSISLAVPAGRYFFAFMLCFFGTGHLINADAVSKLVPPYIPWPLFWTYAGGAALVASGISIFINVKVKFMGLILGIILFLWLVMLHLYYAFRYPEFRDGENIIGSFECLAFCGTALIISAVSPVRDTPIE
jgi:uncharacterized membrane protein